ncbi:MAG: methyltransferase domain-containing protein [Candidatus Magasanikbacteria bacterium]|nr:methyltransferase domain-containing protein [Candidatus Magasanikbacteria bacterium]
MTIWDKIYKDYQKGGEAWATLSEEIHPVFKKFLNKTNFDIKHVLDIGCGTGKYLKFLQAGGFKTDGIDSSETAVQMSKRLLGSDSNIIHANMFEFDIPKNTYDLIISISTIHHGTKKDVQDLINRIYKAIIQDGKIFITVPDYESAKKWETFEKNKKIDEGTFAPQSGPEKDLPHSFYTKKEVQKMFSKFKNLKIDLDKIGRWIVRGIK